MHDTATRAAEALDELVAQFRHADGLIAEQSERIATLEAEITRLQMTLEALAAVA